MFFCYNFLPFFLEKKEHARQHGKKGNFSMKNQKKKLKDFIRKIGSVAFAMLTAVGTTLAVPTEAVHAASLTDGDHSGLVTAGTQYLGAGYSQSDRFGPKTFDCSGFVDRITADAGISDEPLANGWVTDSWVSALDNAGVSYEEVGSQAEASQIDVNAGDIILFMKGNTSVHMGVMVQKNAMMSAIFTGVRINSLEGSPSYDGAKGYDGSTLRQYVAGTGKEFSSIRIYHFNANRNLTVNIEKYSANPEVTNGNPCYSLEGAEFAVFNGSTQIGTLKTDAAGKASGTYSVSADTASLTVKETKASKGYKVNGTTYTLNYNAGDSATVRVPEIGAYDPLSIELTKQSKDKIANPKPLENAEFTIKFYNGYYNAVSDLPAQAAKVWTIKTIKEASGRYQATLDNAHLVSGDTILTNEAGAPIIPLGTLTVQETKAPEGYLIDGVTINGKDVKDFTNDGTALIQNVENAGMTSLEAANTYTLTDTPVRAGFKIQKHDSLTGLQPQGDATDMTTTYNVVNMNNFGVEAHDHDGNVVGEAAGKNDVVYTFTTDTKGYWESSDNFLPAGSYRIEETASPGGYLIQGVSTKDFTITEADNRKALDFTNEMENEAIRAGFVLQKNDADYGKRVQGDGNLSATFNLYNRSANPVVIDKKTYKKDDCIMTFSTDKDGVYTSADRLLPYGTYEIVETKSPEGYTSKGVTKHTFSVREDGKMYDLTAKDVISNTPVTGNFDIIKLTSGAESKFDKPEEGVEFTAILDSKIGEGKSFATWDEAYAAIKAAGVGNDVKEDGIVILSKNEYTVVTTDAEGYAKSTDLVYGTYTVRQTSHFTETQDITEGAQFVVSEENQPTMHFRANNAPIEYYLRFTKSDNQTGKKVVLNAASFKIKNTDTGKYVTMKVGQKKYDTFKTTTTAMVDGNGGTVAAGTFVIPDPDLSDGAQVVTPLTVRAGHYEITEVETPKGFVTLSDPIELTVEESTIYQYDKDSQPIYDIEAKNDRVTGTLNVAKKVEKFTADKTFINREDLSSIKFELRAAEDIIDPADGSVITKNGEVANDIYGKAIGAFNVDKDGNATLKNIPLGKYELKEVYSPDGMIMDPEVKEVVFEQEDKNFTKKEYVVSEEFMNKTTKLEVSKTDATGEEELQGATLQIKDSAGNIVDEWVSTDKKHIVEGLTAKETYTLTETITPKDTETGEDLGYARASSIEFSVDEEGNVTKVHMIDKVVTMTKEDVGGKEVPGAEMSVIDKDGNVVDTWTSSDKAHRIKNLEVGKAYTLVENTAPLGYVKATSVEFTVEDDGKDQELTLVDKVVTVSKKDVAGEEIEGATLTVTDTDGNVIDEWVSDGTDHRVSGLEEGKDYILSETVTADGYVKASDILFTVTGADEDGLKVDQKVEMIDKIVSVTKEDLGGKEVEGAHIQVVDENGNVVDEWDSTKEPHKVNGLEVGKTYTMKETAAPNGYYYSEDVTFTVTDDGLDQSEKMIDRPIVYEINKIDDKTGKPVKGVTLTLTDVTVDEEGNYINVGENGEPAKVELPNNGVTTGEAMVLEQKLIADHTYYLEETEVVGGYFKAAGIQFTVPHVGTDDAQVINITMVDNVTNVGVDKVDNHGNHVSGAKMQIIDKDGNVVYEWTTDGKYRDVSEYVVGGEQYTVREIETPFGLKTIQDVKFIATGSKTKAQIVMAVDQRKTYSVAVQKVDKATNKPLEGAEFTLYTADGNKAKDVNGKECVGVTGKDGKITWTVEYNNDLFKDSKNGGYYVKETKAPAGYLADNELHYVTLSKDYDFALNNPYTITVKDERNDKTGVAAPVAFVAIGGLAAAGLGVVGRKKKDDSEAAE